MQLVAYRNTERSARPLVTEEQRLSSNVAFLERRRVELSAELKRLVKDRENAISRIAYDRKRAQLALKRERESVAQDEAELKRRREEVEVEMAGLAGDMRLLVVAKRLCRVFGITLVELRSDRRSAGIMLARHAFCYWACRLTCKSMPQIGRFLGNRDHTTIMHGRDAYIEKRACMGRTLRKAR